jgi:YD repeat-containing protein
MSRRASMSRFWGTGGNMGRFFKTASFSSLLIVTASVQAACPTGWRCVPPKVGPWVYLSPLVGSGPYAGGWLSEGELQAAEIKHQHDVEKACSTSFSAYDYINKNYVFDGQIEKTSQTGNFDVVSTYYWNSGCASGSRTDSAYVIRTRSVTCGVGQGSDGTYCALGAVIQEKNKGGGSCQFNNDSGSVGSVFVGNPINIGIGNKFQQEIDIPNVGQSPLRFERSYNSMGGAVAYVQSIGGGWFHNYQSMIGFVSLTDTSVAFAYRPDGRVVYFYYKNGVFSPDADESYKLTRSINTQDVATGWTILNPKGQIEVYDGSGRLIMIADRAGGGQRLIYDGDHLLRVEDDFGRSLVFDYSTANGYPGAGLISSVRDPIGQQYKYLYDPSFYPQTVTYPDGKTRMYLYNEQTYTSNVSIPAGALTGIQDENTNRFATFGYDASGRAISTEHAGGVGKYSVVYTSPNQEAKVTDPVGAVRTYTMGSYLGVVKMNGQSRPAGSGCLAASNALTYDAHGNKASEDDFNGHRTCYANDLSRNLETTRIEGLQGGANGNSCTTALAATGFTGLPAETRKITTKWHPDWAIKVQQAEPYLRTTWVYNGQPDPTNSDQTASCAPSTALLPDDGSGAAKPIVVLCKKVEQATTDATGLQGLNPTLDNSDATITSQRQWTYTYNQYGQVLTSTGPQGATTNAYYADTSFTGADPNAVGHYMGDLYTVTNQAGHVTTYNSYDKAGRVLNMTDPNGLVTAYTYWPRGWVKASKQCSGSSACDASTSDGGLRTTYDYWPTGLLKLVTQPDGGSLSYVYDDAHRLTDVTDNLGNTVHYTTTYDTTNKQTLTSQSVKDSTGALTRNISKTFDALNRLQLVTGAAQ